MYRKLTMFIATVGLIGCGSDKDKTQPIVIENQRQIENIETNPVYKTPMNILEEDIQFIDERLSYIKDEYNIQYLIEPVSEYSCSNMDYVKLGDTEDVENKKELEKGLFDFVGLNANLKSMIDKYKGYWGWGNINTFYKQAHCFNQKIKPIQKDVSKMIKKLNKKLKRLRTEDDVKGGDMGGGDGGGGKKLGDGSGGGRAGDDSGGKVGGDGGSIGGGTGGGG